MVSRGKSKRKREAILRSSQHGGERLPPPPVKGTKVQGIPAKLRRLMELRAAVSEGERGRSKPSDGDKHGPAAGPGGPHDNGGPKRDDGVGEGKRKRKGEAPGKEEGKEAGGQAARNFRKGESLVRAIEEEKKRMDGAKDRRKRYLTLKKKKKKKGGAGGEDGLGSRFGGGSAAGSVPFGEVVQAPPKLTATPKHGAKLGETSKQRVIASTAAGKILSDEEGGVHHFPEAMGSKAANLERLRNQAVEAYRQRKGRKALPVFADSLPTVPT